MPNGNASVTADLSQISSVQLLFILTTLKPITKVSELRIDMRYSMLGERCHAAHKRQMDHQSSAWNRVAEPVLGSGVNMTDEGIERIAIECGWRATWMTEAVTIYSRRRQAKAKASPDGRLSFAPAAPAASPASPGTSAVRRQSAHKRGRQSATRTATCCPASSQ